MFKAITVFKFDPTSKTGRLLNALHLSAEVPEPTIVDPDATQWARSGFSREKQFGAQTIFVHNESTCVFNIQVRQRVLPSAVIRTALTVRATEAERRQGYKPGRKDMREIKEKVIASLLPTAFIRPTNVLCMVCHGYLFIGTSSAKMIDIVLDTLREVYPDDVIELRSVDRGYEVGPWLSYLMFGGTTDSGLFTLGKSASLRGKDKSVARFKEVNLSDANVRESMAAGMRPFELAIEYQGDRATFVLTERMQLKRIKFSDILLNLAAEDSSDGDHVERFDAEVALMSGEIPHLLGDLLADIPLADGWGAEL